MYEVHVVDRWDAQRKYVYVFARNTGGGTSYLTKDNEWVYIPPGQGFMDDYEPTLTIDNEWEQQLAAQLTYPNKTPSDIYEEVAKKETERVDKFINSMLGVTDGS